MVPQIISCVSCSQQMWITNSHINKKLLPLGNEHGDEYSSVTQSCGEDAAETKVWTPEQTDVSKWTQKEWKHQNKRSNSTITLRVKPEEVVS